MRKWFIQCTVCTFNWNRCVFLSAENGLGFLCSVSSVYAAFHLHWHPINNRAETNSRQPATIDRHWVRPGNILLDIRKFWLQFYLLIRSHYTHSTAMDCNSIQNRLLLLAAQPNTNESMLFCNCHVGSRKYKSNQRMREKKKMLKCVASSTCEQ